MTVGINGYEANDAHRVGIGQYAFEVLRHLAPLKTKSINFKIFLPSPPLGDMPKESSNWQYKVCGPQKMWTLTGLQRQLLREKLDVFFSPAHYLPLIVPAPAVVAIMDLAFERFPQYFKARDLYQLRYWTRYSVHQAKRILAISQSTKQDLIDLYHVPGNKIVVTYLGYDQNRFNTKVNSLKSAVSSRENRYLLFLGTLQPRKNLVRLIEAFAYLPEKDLKLIVVGMKSEGRGGWMYQEIFDRVKQLGLEERVDFRGYIPDSEVPKLMAGSVAYVLPSLYEGFGIPAIEAMATGTPVVVSKVSSLPEICGEAATYINDPYEVASIRSALQGVLDMTEAERQNRVASALKWVKRYNWETTAKQTLEVLVEVAKKHV